MGTVFHQALQGVNAASGVPQTQPPMELAKQEAASAQQEGKEQEAD